MKVDRFKTLLDLYVFIILFEASQLKTQKGK